MSIIRFCYKNYWTTRLYHCFFKILTIVEYAIIKVGKPSVLFLAKPKSIYGLIKNKDNYSKIKVNRIIK